MEEKSILFAIRKNNYIYMLLQFFIVLTCILIFVMNGEHKQTIQNLRLLYASALEDAENLNIERLTKYTYYIVDIDGKVMSSTNHQHKEGDIINLHILTTGIDTASSSAKCEFVAPLVKDGRQFGTLVIEYGNKTTAFSTREKNIILALIFLLMMSIGWGVLLNHFLKRNVVQPLIEMNDFVWSVLSKNSELRNVEVKYYETIQLKGKILLLEDEICSVEKQSQKVAEREKLLLASVSHDLRTPISTIIGCAEGIRDGRMKEQQNNHYLQLIIDKAVHLTHLIDAILEETNVEMEEQLKKRQEIYSEKYIEDILKEFLLNAQRKELTLRWEKIPNVLLFIDPERIFQVFQNIIENSLKYTPAGGEIKIRFGIENQALVVEIEDNGQGVAAVDLPFIFERFYRGETARTQKEKSGSGLGLCIVKKILQLHGTSIACDSVSGKGTVMRFLLPLS